MFDASSYTETSPAGRPLEAKRAMRLFESVVGRDRRAIKANHVALRRLNDVDEITVLPAHDSRILDDLNEQRSARSG
ncbi:hypothetical protein ACHMWU_25265 [Aeromicrobium sp. UC242_57]